MDCCKIVPIQYPSSKNSTMTSWQGPMNKPLSVYMDNAAAVPPSPEILDFYRKACLENYCNQEAVHAEAYRVRRLMKGASNEFAMALTGTSDTGVFQASSGTEALAL